MAEEELDPGAGGDDRDGLSDAMQQLRRQVEGLASTVLAVARSVPTELAQVRGELALIQRMLADLWPPRLNDEDDAGGSSGNFFYLASDGGSPGNAVTTCSFTYTVQALNTTGTGPGGGVIGAGVPLTGAGQRLPFGAMNAATIGFGFSGSSGVVLLWANETPAVAKMIPVSVSPNGGEDGTDTAFATWTYDFTDFDGTPLGTAAPVVKHRLSLGSVIPATAGSYGVAIDYGNGNYALWDVQEIYDTTICAPTGGSG